MSDWATVISMDQIPELDDAVQNLSEALDRRLVVIDQARRVVAYSIHESPKDRQRLFHLLAHSDSWSPPRTAKTQYQIQELPDVGILMFLRLLDSQRHTIGHVIVPLNEPTVDEELARVVEGAADQLAKYLEARQQETANRSMRSHHLTVALVTGNPQEREAAAEDLIDGRMLSNSASYCAVTMGVNPRGARSLDHEKTARAVTRTLKFVRDTSTATVVGGMINDEIGVLVFPRPVVVPRLMRILEDPLISPVRAGVGPLTSINDIHRSFEKAQLTLRATWLAPEDHQIVATWEGVGLDGTLVRMPVENFLLEDLPPSTRDLLAAVDSPDLLATLVAYLNAGGDAQQTARDLNIHRSTLYYRLDKLRNVIPGELNDGVLRRELHTGLRVARLAGLVKISK